MKPALHTGWHTVFLAIVALQLPLAPFASATVPLHVLCEQDWSPGPAGAVIVCPALHAEQSTVLSVSHSVPPVPVATAGVPSWQLHTLAAHTLFFNV